METIDKFMDKLHSLLADENKHQEIIDTVRKVVDSLEFGAWNSKLFNNKNN